MIKSLVFSIFLISALCFLKLLVCCSGNGVYRYDINNGMSDVNGIIGKNSNDKRHSVEYLPDICTSLLDID